VNFNNKRWIYETAVKSKTTNCVLRISFRELFLTSSLKTLVLAYISNKIKKTILKGYFRTQVS